MAIPCGFANIGQHFTVEQASAMQPAQTAGPRQVAGFAGQQDEMGFRR